MNSDFAMGAERGQQSIQDPEGMNVVRAPSPANAQETDLTSGGDRPYPEDTPEDESVAVVEELTPPEFGYNPDLWLYRERTIALLKRYLRLSIEVGRLPSLLGRELFRSKVTSYRMQSFEDAVIFVHDVERALDQLDPMGKDLIAVIVFQDYNQDEAAEVLRCARRTVCRQFPETIDQISELFLEGGLLNRLPPRPQVNQPSGFDQGG